MRHDIIEYAEVSPVIGRTVTVTVDRPLGSYHPEHKDMYFGILWSMCQTQKYGICITRIENFLGKTISEENSYR